MDEIKELRARLEEYARAYYENDAPVVSDFEYDELMRRLRELEREHPEADVSGSITQRVGGSPSDRFPPLPHAVPLESLMDVFSTDELRKFNESVVKALGEQPEYVVEPKVDGLSVAVEYIKGKRGYVATRGDGMTGEDVSVNAFTIKDLPKSVKKAPPRLIVRGEVYMSFDDFDSHCDNQLSMFGQEDERKLTYNTPRNAAAGILRKKYSAFQFEPESSLSIVIFDVMLVEKLSRDKHEQTLSDLEAWGFPTIPRTVHPDIESAIAAVERLGEMRESFDFAIDGAVIKVNGLAQRRILGSTSRAPKWAVAFKYPPEQRLSVVKDIVIQVGRTGVLTPKAILSPVRLSGTNVTNATLHNADFITEKDVRIGDTVFVRKAGEIIPEVVGVELSMRPENAKPFVFPVECPECGAPAVRESGESAVKCVNAECPVRLAGNLMHFAGREAMDIEGLGETTVNKFLELKLGRYPNDIYVLSHEDILRLCDYSSTLANKLSRAIEASKSRGTARLLFALGIPHLGQRGAKLLAERFESVDALMEAPPEEITAVRDIGATIAQSVYDWLRGEHGRTIITSLKDNGVTM